MIMEDAQDMSLSVGSETQGLSSDLAALDSALGKSEYIATPMPF